MDVPRTLVVANDFPPRVGGVQQYIFNLVRHLPPERMAVLAPNWPGWREHDSALEFPVHRFPAKFMWPTRDVERRVAGLIREHEADVVLFGHGLPLGLLGPRFARRDMPYLVATHGTEYWMAQVPGTAAALAHATSDAKRVLALTHYTASRIRDAVPASVPLSVLFPAVDHERFRPDVDGGEIRRRHGLGNRPVVLCVSRLVPRKGQDVLIRALARIRRKVPETALVLVGDGPHGRSLQQLATGAGLPPDSVVFAGQISEGDLPAYYAACDVFAMPCRSRYHGLEVEGFGIVFIEAAATGKPSVAGDSGGAAEAVVDGETGLIVDGRDVAAVAESVSALLADPARSAAMGTAGRRRVETTFTWPTTADRLAGWLGEAAG